MWKVKAAPLLKVFMLPIGMIITLSARIEASDFWSLAPHANLVADYTSKDPGASPEISRLFLDNEPLRKEYLFQDFLSNINWAESLLTEEEDKASLKFKKTWDPIRQAHHEKWETVVQSVEAIQARFPTTSSGANQGGQGQSNIGVPQFGQFRSPPGSFRSRVESLQDKVIRVTPTNDRTLQAKDLSLQTIQIADATYAEGRYDEGEGLYSVAVSLADIALGMTPGVGLGKDAYELLTGKSLLTGNSLTSFERGFAFFSVMTLGGAGAAAKFGKALSTLAKRVAGPSAELALEIGDRLTKAIGQTGYDKFIKGEWSEKALEYIVRVTGTNRAKTLIEADYIKIGEAYAELEKQMSKAPGIELKAVVTRATRKEGVTAEGVPFKNSPDDVFTVPAANKWIEHRYSIGGEFGERALYTVLGEGDAAVKTALAELKVPVELADGVHIGTKQVSLKKVLDLRDGDLLKSLGLSIDDLTEPEHYGSTQMIGNLARKLGFNGIIAESAENRGAYNLVIFEE